VRARSNKQHCYRKVDEAIISKTLLDWVIGMHGAYLKELELDNHFQDIGLGCMGHICIRETHHCVGNLKELRVMHSGAVIAALVTAICSH
jgi:hypothetical protein